MFGESFYLLDSSSVGFILLLACVVIFNLSYETKKIAWRIPQFNGPAGWPVIGNLLDIKGSSAQQFRAWSNIYGDVFQIHLGDIPVLVVNSASAAKAIFSGHSNALCSRPVFFTFHKLISKTAGVTMGTAPSSKTLNKGRKDTPLGKPAVRSYIKCLDIETRTFIDQCLSAANKELDPLRLLQRMSLSLDLTLCWGRRVSLQDTLLAEIVEVEHEIVNMRNTMTNIQDCVQVLRFPWSSTTKKAHMLRERRDTYFAQLNNELDEKILNGVAPSCIRAELLGRDDVNEEELNLVCLTFISAGMAPTVATLQWSIAFLSQRPDIQATAFNSIREHYGGDYKVLGNIDDDQGCAYIVALIKECLRYFTVARTSLPRSTIKEFSYDGKIVPVGTTVFLNAWSCNMDEKIWSSPSIFDPTRWLENPDAPLFTYGLGSRSCSGVSLANRFLYMFFVRLISAFEIQKSGTLDVDPITGCKSHGDLVSSIKRFTVNFIARDEIVLREALDRRMGVEKWLYNETS